MMGTRRETFLDSEVDCEASWRWTKQHQSQSSSWCQFCSKKSLFSFFIFSARCDLIQPIKSLPLSFSFEENNLLMSLWQARKIAFVQQANNIRHVSPTKTKTEKESRLLSHPCSPFPLVYAAPFMKRISSVFHGKICFFSDKIHKFSLRTIFTILLIHFPPRI